MGSFKFDFNRYRQIKVSWKTLVRLLVYSITVIILLYLIVNKSKEVEEDHSVEFDIELELE